MIMRKNDNKGFTLIEVVIAVLILSFILTAVYGYLFGATARRNNAELRVAAAGIAQGILEEYRSETFSTLTGSTTNVEIEGDLATTFKAVTTVTDVDLRKMGDVVGTATFDAGKLTNGSNAFKSVATATDPEAKVVQTEVSWGDGTSENVTMNTLICKP